MNTAMFSGEVEVTTMAIHEIRDCKESSMEHFTVDEVCAAQKTIFDYLEKENIFRNNPELSIADSKGVGKYDMVAYIDFDEDEYPPKGRAIYLKNGVIVEVKLSRYSSEDWTIHAE